MQLDFFLTFIYPGKLFENHFSFTNITWPRGYRKKIKIMMTKYTKNTNSEGAVAHLFIASDQRAFQ